MAGERYMDLFAGPLAKGPNNCVRFASDPSGVVWISVKGGEFTTIQSFIGSFGSNTIVNLPDSLSILVEAWRGLIEFLVNTSGAVESRRREFLELASVETEVGGSGFNSHAFVTMVLGAVANGNYLRQTSAGTWDMSAGGSAVLGLSNVLVTCLNGLQVNGSFAQTRAGAVAIATSVTFGLGNTQPLTGAGTISQLVMTGKAAGFIGVLELAAGQIVTHNVAGTGATIMTSTSASATAGPQGKACHLYYNGTNVFVQV